VSVDSRKILNREANMVKLGSKVRDMVTGFEGIAHARQSHMYGCERIEVEPTELTKDGGLKDTQVFDEQRVEVLEEKDFTFPEPAIALGAKVQDTITPLSGTASCLSVDMFGRQYVGIEPDGLHEGKPIKCTWLRVERVRLVEAKKPPLSAASSARAGGPDTSGWGRR